MMESVTPTLDNGSQYHTTNVAPQPTELGNETVDGASNDARRIEVRGHGMWVLAWCCVLCVLVVDAYNNLGRLISIAGALALILLGFIFSNSRSAINWYQIMWGIMLQFVLGVLVLRWAHGRDALQCIADKVKTFLSFTFDGSTFVFGYLAKGFVLTNPSPSEALSPFLNSTVPNITEFVGPTIKNLPPVFLFLALPVIFFFSFFVSILYFYGIMQWVVLRMGQILQLTIGATACESVCTAANIFLGM
ncbi:hypothetical protein HPB47_002987, partial [Ixodes persulcatus]